MTKRRPATIGDMGGDALASRAGTHQTRPTAHSRRIGRAAALLEGERELTTGALSKDSKSLPCRWAGGPSGAACWSGGLFPRQRLIHSSEPKSVDNPVNILPCGRTVTS